MENDEAQVRQVVQTWMDATRAGDIETVLGLMTDDVVFLVTGRRPMIGKAAFAAAAATPPGAPRPQFDGASDIREIRVIGDHAYLWSELTVTVRPPGGAAPIVRTGHTLTIFRKEGGRWLLARDANMLATVNPQ